MDLKYLKFKLMYCQECSVKLVFVVFRWKFGQTLRIKVSPKFKDKNLSKMLGLKFVQNLKIKICPKFKDKNLSKI
jgi:hypothetical protein